jgi:hypothetical protein
MTDSAATQAIPEAEEGGTRPSLCATAPPHPGAPGWWAWYARGHERNEIESPRYRPG